MYAIKYLKTKAKVNANSPTTHNDMKRTSASSESGRERVTFLLNTNVNNKQNNPTYYPAQQLHINSLLLLLLSAFPHRSVAFIYRNKVSCRFSTLLWCRWRWWWCLLLMTILTTAAAKPQGCILCDNGDLKGKYPQHNYEEFRFEHQVTRQDAIAALRQLNDSFYEGSSMDNSCNSIRCTNKIMKYCLSSQFINDHCLCELAHNMEGLPFVPHICYVGEKAYKASVGSCFIYEEVKDCCCAPALATQWRHISAASSLHTTIVPHVFSVIFTSLLWFLC